MMLLRDSLVGSLWGSLDGSVPGHLVVHCQPEHRRTLWDLGLCWPEDLARSAELAFLALMLAWVFGNFQNHLEFPVDCMQKQ